MTGNSVFPAREILTTALIANHVEFLRTHRGDIEQEDGLWRCASGKSAFCFAILTNSATFERGLRDDVLYVPSWLEPQIPASLAERLKLSHSLTYMIRPPASGPSAPNPNIRHVDTRERMEHYADIQGRAFCDDEPTYAEWRPWMGAADVRNLGNAQQEFFVQYESGQPVAGAITVYADSIAGIYGVATLPSHQKQGLATALLNHANAAARKRGFSILGLQAATGSNAERLYAAQGFLPLFHMRIFRRGGS